ncbi:hypothetical protein [Vulcanisaeta sp. JCM 16161]|uniref:hypothetical protein n=1 Tax=Vulcanisaeta sp. JCM 16161 TaxID=1295372 RepID=UPI000A4ABFB4|nr:hypothetical protein [Vulcanisaeta sp. JCM 16161]
MNNEALVTNPIELLRVAVNDGDLSGLTQSLITASALLIRVMSHGSGTSAN